MRKIIIFTLAWFSLCSSSFSRNVSNIRLGAIFDETSNHAQVAFHYAVQEVNNLKTIGTIKPVAVKVQYGNEFEASMKLCDFIKDGIWAVLGPSSPDSFNHIRSVCGNKGISLIGTAYDDYYEDSIVNIHPYPSILEKAFVDLVNELEWEEFTVLYENGPWISQVGELLEKTNEYDYNIKLTELELKKGNYRATLIQARNSGETNFVICCSTETLHDVLEQAQQVGMMTIQYNYIISSLDLNTMNLVPYQYSGVDITGIQMVDPTSDIFKKVTRNLHTEKMSLGAALAYDAVQLFTETVKQNPNVGDRIKRVSCEGNSGVVNNTSEVSGLMKKISINGLTGNIKFDEEGKRSEFLLDIVGLTGEGIQKIGIWDSVKGLSIWNETFENDEEHLAVDENDDETIYGKQLTVLISLNQNQPYAKLKQGSEKLNGNDKYEGFVIELIHELAEMVGFNYTFKIQADKTYGSKNWLTGEWNGMMKEVIDNRVDLAIGDLTITSQRESAVDFTDPFINIGISILYRKPEATVNPNPLYFLLPFSEELWIYLIGAFVVTTISLFIIGRITPGEWINPHPCVKKPDYLENQFDFCNSWWFTLGTMFQQGSNIVPKTLPTRIVATVWWFFVLIMITFYIAQLAALFILYTPFMRTPISKINSIEDLANLDGEVPFGAIKSGTTYKFFGTSDNPYYRKIYQWMEQHPEYMIFTNSEGVERVKQEDFAFLMESASIDYVVERQCDLMKVGGLLDSKGYGIAMSQGSPYRAPLNDAILRLQQSGQLSYMIHKWWKEDNRGFCSTDTMESLMADQLTIEVAWGLFVILLLGCLVAFLIGALLMCFDTAKRAYTLDLPFFELLKNDIKLFTSRAGLKIGKVKQNPTDVVLRVPQTLPVSSAPHLLPTSRSPNRMQTNRPSISVTQPSPTRRY